MVRVTYVQTRKSFNEGIVMVHIKTEVYFQPIRTELWIIWFRSEVRRCGILQVFLRF